MILSRAAEAFKHVPNICQPLQAVQVFAVAHSFAETCGFASNFPVFPQAFS
jgi:hypothetical protein